ncbi:MAG: DMT family transporter [Bacteroidales bacterium]|nr:DMT family transporter [Candidatus Physcousia equi]
MTWLLYAFLSAALLGLYDVCKKHALRNNAVIPVLLLNTVFCSLIFLPMVLLSAQGAIGEGSLFYIPQADWHVQRYVLLKSCIVLSSWICAYCGIKHLPLTLAGPINATRPVMVLVGALFIFGERLNAMQWMGVALAVLSFYMLSRSGKKEGIDFKHNRWVVLIVLGSMLGACSALYDKFLMASPDHGGLGLNRMVVQSYFNFYQAAMMLVMLMLLWWPKRKRSTPFHWDWAIVFISIFLSVADFVYFYALSLDGAMVSVVSLARRSSVVVSFFVGAYVFRERNLKSKALDLLLVLLGMLFLYLGAAS